ncbi:MAG: DUF805 domain-containing protein [Lachnospiraceae bacterium]|nr:DUF805 domain-containing protein [Lachnospiraceae bacterium]
MSYFIDMYKNYVNFSGRATRKQFWCAYGIWFAIYMVLYILTIVTGGVAIGATGADFSGASAIGMLFVGLMGIFALGSVLPVLAIEVRRLRDAGFQWWVLLLCMIGSCCGIGAIVLIVLLCLPTKNPEQEF